MATPIPVASGTGDTQVAAARPGLRLRGFSCTETAGSAATAEFILYHGTSNSDPQLLAPVTFLANGTGFPWFGDHGIDCPNGIYLDRISGTTTLVVYVDPLEATL